MPHLTNYSEHTSFSNNNWNGWTIIEPSHALKFINEAQNTYVRVNTSPPLLPLPDHYEGMLLIHKEVTSFIAGECYTIALRAKCLSDTVKSPQLSWYIDSTIKHRSNFKANGEWQHFVIPFKATQSTHILTLGSDLEGEFALDDIRIFPHVLNIDFEDEEAVDIPPNEERPLRHFTLRNASSNGEITGIRNVERTKPGMAVGKALILARNQSTANQVVQLDLYGEYHNIEFFWTQLHSQATVSFFTPDGKLIEKVSHEGGAGGRDFQVSYTSPKSKPISRLQFDVKDHSYIDFMTLKALNC
ncbi:MULTISPECIES: hypothetical protein [Pseudomonas]|uniref:CBM-cenC domain-containing protein n=1 Tax=Pseudomonas putida S13.1.2 TaxID=1384061 RepID=A0AAU8S588_PSEPU|nr:MULTISPECIES: hypothetical protein [Pseudomonas]AJQ50676.1 hypothetical protein N805_27045 [Pseudomonas putida S13.1.2]